MNLGLDFRRGTSLIPASLESMVARINTVWKKEHKIDGTHGAVRADSVTTPRIDTTLIRGIRQLSTNLRTLFLQGDFLGLTISPTLDLVEGTQVGTAEPILVFGRPEVSGLPASDLFVLALNGGGGVIPLVVTGTQFTIDMDPLTLTQGHVQLGASAALSPHITHTGTLVHITEGGGTPGTHGVSIGSIIGGSDDPPEIILHDGDQSGSHPGPSVRIGRNINTSGAPAAGTVALTNLNGTLYYLWVDTNGVLRQHTSRPTTAGGDTAGIPIGQENTVTPLTSPNIVYASSALNYQKIGRWVYITGFVTFPATADANQAAINNLPFTCENTSQARGGSVCPFSNSGAVESLLVLSNSTTAHFFNPATGAARTNANLSGAQVFFDFKYRATS